MKILSEEEGFQFGFKRWQGWAVSTVGWEWIPNLGSKARKGAKALNLAFVLLDFQHAGVSYVLQHYCHFSTNEKLFVNWQFSKTLWRSNSWRKAVVNQCLEFDVPYAVQVSPVVPLTRVCRSFFIPFVALLSGTCVARSAEVQVVLVEPFVLSSIYLALETDCYLNLSAFDGKSRKTCQPF